MLLKFDNYDKAPYKVSSYPQFPRQISLPCYLLAPYPGRTNFPPLPWYTNKLIFKVHDLKQSDP